MQFAQITSFADKSEKGVIYSPCLRGPVEILHRWKSQTKCPNELQQLLKPEILLSTAKTVSTNTISDFSGPIKSPLFLIRRREVREVVYLSVTSAMNLSVFFASRPDNVFLGCGKQIFIKKSFCCSTKAPLIPAHLMRKITALYHPHCVSLSTFYTTRFKRETNSLQMTRA